MTGAETGPRADAADRDERLARARRRVAEIKGLYAHLLMFVLVVGGLFVVNLMVGGPWWVAWVVLGWGIGIVAHAFGVLVHGSRWLADWEARKIKQLMDDR